MQGYYKQKAYIAAQGNESLNTAYAQHGVYMYLCRPPTKLIGGFLEDGLGTEAADNSDAYKMLRRESKHSKCLLFIADFTNMFVFVSIEKV